MSICSQQKLKTVLGGSPPEQIFGGIGIDSGKLSKIPENSGIDTNTNTNTNTSQDSIDLAVIDFFESATVHSPKSVRDLRHGSIESVEES